MYIVIIIKKKTLASTGKLVFRTIYKMINTELILHIKKHIKFRMYCF